MAFDLIKDGAGNAALALRCDNLHCLRPIRKTDLRSVIAVLPDHAFQPYVTACDEACANRIAFQESFEDFSEPVEWQPLVPAVHFMMRIFLATEAEIAFVPDTAT